MRDHNTKGAAAPADVDEMGTLPVNGVNGHIQRSLTPYEQMVRTLSDRLVEAQRPIRILDAIKWDDDVERAFFEKGCRELPSVTRDYYLSRPLPFDPEKKLSEFHTIERDIRRQLGEYNAPGQIMARMCQEYREVVHLLTHRGTLIFAEISERLYGSSSDSFHAGDPNLVDLGHMMSDILDNLSHDTIFGNEEADADAPQAVAALADRLKDFFGDPGAVRVRLSDGIVADAAAGSDYIKIRNNARFTPREVRLLEVHEGWVHLGTTLNGQMQPICTFLSKGPPSSTITQEGLAVISEIFAFASHPGRVRRLTNRIEGVAMAEAGANFLDVYRYFLEEGYSSRESYQHTHAHLPRQSAGGVRPVHQGLVLQQGLRADLQLHSPGRQPRDAAPRTAAVLRQDDAGRHQDHRATRGGGTGGPAALCAAGLRRSQCPLRLDVFCQFPQSSIAEAY